MVELFLFLEFICKNKLQRCLSPPPPKSDGAQPPLQENESKIIKVVAFFVECSYTILRTKKNI